MIAELRIEIENTFNSPIYSAYCRPTLFRSNFTALDYFLWDHMNSLFYDIPMELEDDLLTRIMASADVWLLDIRDHVYENMVLRYRVCVEVAGHHTEPFL